MIKGVHTIICEVSDMQRSVAFYRDILQLQVPFTSEHWTSVNMGSTRIGLHPPMGDSTDSKGSGWVIGVEVDDIAALKSHLESKAIFTGDYHDTPAGVVMDFSDPDGNRLQAMQVGAKAADLS